MTTSRFPGAPAQIAALKVDHRGFPVPWFVPWFDGKPDFSCVDPGAISKAHREHLCWICGKRLGPRKAFVIGPMCAVNRVSAEPPSCIVCARFAAVSCPFLSKPLAKRIDNGRPHQAPAGIMIERNPGVTLVWEVLSYRVEKQPDGGMLFRIGSPTRVSWWREGREATRDEVVESLRTGLPILREMAEQDGPGAIELLNACIARAVKLVPA